MPKLWPSSVPWRSVVNLAWRKGLPGSDSPTFQATLKPFRADFPHLVTSETVSSKTKDLKDYGASSKQTVMRALDKHGALLIRGLPLETAEEFSVFYSGFGLRNVPYVGGVSVGRHRVKDDVHLASLDPPEFTIEPHQEMSYSETFPDLFFLFCEVPPGPGCGGESGVTDAREVARNLDPEVVDKFRRLGVSYGFYLPDRDRQKSSYSTWQETLRTDSKTEAEEILKTRGFDFKWDEDGSMTYRTNMLPAFRKHRISGESIWFNQVFVLNPTAFRIHPQFQDPNIPDGKFPVQSFYGDGSPIEAEVIQHMREVTWSCTVGEQLQKGDILVLDNMLMMHSRLGFTGPRKLVVAQGMCD